MNISKGMESSGRGTHKLSRPVLYQLLERALTLRGKRVDNLEGKTIYSLSFTGVGNEK